MTKIAIAARYADDSPYGRAQVTIRLVDGTAGASLPGGLSVERTFVTCDSDGEYEIDLTPNEDITDPPGTYYALTVERTSPTVVRYIEVPQPNGSGPGEVPYAWDDETIQRLVPDPPKSIPAAGSGDVADVLTVVDDGRGKEWKARPPTGGGGTTVHGEWVEYVTDAPAGLPGWVSFEAYGSPPGTQSRLTPWGGVEFMGFAMYLDSGGSPAEPPPGTLLCTLDPAHLPVSQPPILAGGQNVYGSPLPLGIAALSVDLVTGEVTILAVPAGTTAVVVPPTTWDVAP